MKPPLTSVSSPRGAPMGRPEKFCLGQEGPFRVEYVPFVDGGYDEGGAYWGLPADLYRCRAENASGFTEFYIREDNRDAVVAYVLQQYPWAKIEPEDPEALTDFLRGYITTALWSATNDKGEPLDDRSGITDVTPECYQAMAEDCTDFLAGNRHLLDQLDATDDQHGHDFWLTRNHHGAGFWDRGYGAIGKELTEAAHAYGGVDLWQDENGKVHQA